MVNTNKFTIFKDFNEKQSSMRVSDFDTIISILKSEVLDLQVASITERINNEPDPKRQTDLKKQLPFLTVSSLFYESATSKEIYPTIKDVNGKDVLDEKGEKVKGNVQLSHSGYVCIDFDYLSDTQLTTIQTWLKEWETTILLHVSPRGKGIKAYFKINGIESYNHELYYTCLMLFLYEKVGVLADTSCTNVNRGTFLPYQPNYFYNPTAVPIDGYELLKTYGDAPKKVKELKRIIDAKGVLPANVHTWDVDKKDVPVKKKETSKTNNSSVATISILSDQQKFDKYAEYLVSKTGNPSEGNDRHGFYLKLVNLKTERIAPVDILQMAIDWTANNKELVNPYSSGEIRDYLGRSLANEKGYEIPPYILYPQQNQRGSKDRLTQRDIRIALSTLYDFYFDEGSRTYYYATATNTDPFLFKPFSQRDDILNTMVGELEDMGLNIFKGKLEETIFNEKTFTKINYLEKCLMEMKHAYDGEDHLSKLFTSIQVDEPDLFKHNLTKWAVNVVAQILGTHRKSVNDNAIILTGAQNSGKTSWFEQLLWDDNLFANRADFDFSNKNHMILMSKYIIINLDEMASYNKNDIKLLKSGMTEKKLVVDRKFKDEANYKRVASFVGCSNQQDCLRDPTGDRRFLPFEILNPVDWLIYESVDKKQLWGQLTSMYLAGFDYKFSNDENNDNMRRNKEGFTAYMPEDTFIDEKLIVTKHDLDFISCAELDRMITDFKIEEKVTGYLNVNTIKDKIKVMGAKLNIRRRIVGKQVRGISNVRFRTTADNKYTPPTIDFTDPNFLDM